MRKSLLFAIAFLILTFCPIDIKADTISLSGGVNFSGFFNFNVNFAGFNTPATTFSFSGSGNTQSGVNFPKPTDVPGGTVLNIGGSLFLNRFDFFSFPPAIVRINGINYPVNLVSVVVTPTFVTVPFTTANTIMLSAPCSVSGSVSGQSGPFSTVGAGFNGNCTASMTLTFFRTDTQGNRHYNFQSSSYAFAAVPVPEPATMLLLGTGLAGIVIRVRKRRKAV